MKALRRTLVVLVLAFGVTLAGTAQAGERPLPWSGGQEVVSPFETRTALIASELAGRPVKVICNGATDWAALAAQGGFDGAWIWGYVVSLTDYTHLSEQACWYADQFWLDGSPRKPPRDCQTSTRTAYGIQKRIRVKGQWTTKLVGVTRTREKAAQVPIKVPVYGLCPDYVRRLFAIQTIPHEAMHLRGVMSEAIAECWGMQNFAWVVQRLGATPSVARAMATDFWNMYYVPIRTGTEYGDPQCRDGGALDLWPARSGWPTPN